ncbi:unnamed protein product [Phaedon cochleariae]|uniref:Homeobox domain-containing protein n=1 Tax=Phaedon cochleariae TaxID=80249 RepID=A0A9N9X0B5_PHACE|nr:unnamed protein product [Phaedon cochleariae]
MKKTVGLQVKIWFQNRRSKYKKMMKAAQVPGGGTNNNGTGGGHGGLLGPNANMPPSSPGAQGQNMMQGRIKMEGGGSSSGSPATGGYLQHPSPAPSSTPGSDMSSGGGGGQQAGSPGGGPGPAWPDIKPPHQQGLHAPPPHPAPHPHAAAHPPPHNYLPQYSWLISQTRNGNSISILIPQVAGPSTMINLLDEVI